MTEEEQAKLFFPALYKHMLKNGVQSWNQLKRLQRYTIAPFMEWIENWRLRQPPKEIIKPPPKSP